MKSPSRFLRDIAQTNQSISAAIFVVPVVFENAGLPCSPSTRIFPPRGVDPISNPEQGLEIPHQVFLPAHHRTPLEVVGAVAVIEAHIVSNAGGDNVVNNPTSL
jgi:hypothetical protein